MRRLRYNSSHFVCRADQLVQKVGEKPFMKNFRSLEMSEHRVRDDLASGNFGLGKKNARFSSPNAQILTPPPLVCGRPMGRIKPFGEVSSGAYLRFGRTTGHCL
jgi:hypothetical protein